MCNNILQIDVDVITYACLRVIAAFAKLKERGPL